MGKKRSGGSPLDGLLAFALAYPAANEDFPWGERVVKVGKRVFVFLGKGDSGAGLRLSVKLPESREEALEHDYAEPTGYGLGKSGWVTITFEDPQAAPLDQLCEWLDESYRAIAPQRLVDQIDDAAARSALKKRR